MIDVGDDGDIADILTHKSFICL